MLTPFPKYPFIILCCCILTLFVLTQCNRNDPCKKIYCENGGVCFDEGVCRCPEGFAGKRCEINTKGNDPCSTIRECTKGKYQARETCTATGNNLFYVDISLSLKKSDEIFITNFGNSNFTVTAQVNGTQINIPVNAVGPYIFSGTGTIDTTVAPLEIFIEYTENNSQDYCTGTYTME